MSRLFKSTAKRLTAAVIGLVVTTFAGAAEGLICFANTYHWSIPPVDVPFFDGHGSPLSGTSYLAQLYAGKTADFLAPFGPPVPFLTDGYFDGGRVELPASVAGFGGPVWGQVRVWEAAGGQTFEQAALAGWWTGRSGLLFLPITGHRGVNPLEAVPLTGLQYPGKPMIICQPRSLMVRTGEGATLSVTASSGVAMFYQWYQGSTGDTNSPMAGATNVTWTTPSLAANSSFWVSVTNYVGSVNSDSAMVTVLPASTARLSLRFDSGVPSLVIDGALGTTYRVDYNENLGGSQWIELTNLTLPTNPFTFFDAQATNSSMRFYRVVAP